MKFRQLSGCISASFIAAAVTRLEFADAFFKLDISGEKSNVPLWRTIRSRSEVQTALGENLFSYFPKLKWTRSWRSCAIASLKVYRRVHIFFLFLFFLHTSFSCFFLLFHSLPLFFLFFFFCYFSRQASRFDWLWRIAGVTRTFPRISWRVYAFRTHPQERAAI